MEQFNSTTEQVVEIAKDPEIRGNLIHALYVMTLRDVDKMLFDRKILKKGELSSLAKDFAASANKIFEIDPYGTMKTNALGICDLHIEGALHRGGNVDSQMLYYLTASFPNIEDMDDIEHSVAITVYKGDGKQ